MRDFRLQALINVLKILYTGEMVPEEVLRYCLLWLGPRATGKIITNKIFDRRDISRLRSFLIKMGRDDPAWFPRLFEPTTLGIRSWEYGLLLKNTSFKNKTVLDAGAGNSRFPKYLSRKGARVTMLDMMNPLEETELKRDKNLKFVLGDMTNLSFRDNSFDRVVCISAIEHVDMKSNGGFYLKKEYINRALQALRELARVTKKNGVLYVTTDFYLPEQKTDAWSGSVDGIRGAFPWRCIELFKEELHHNGIQLTKEFDHSERDLRVDINRSTFRGRYFTTAAFLGKKI